MRQPSWNANILFFWDAGREFELQEALGDAGEMEDK